MLNIFKQPDVESKKIKKGSMRTTSSSNSPLSSSWWSSASFVSGFRIVGRLLLATLCLINRVHGDLDYIQFTNDTDGGELMLHFVNRAEAAFFSAEHIEYCNPAHARTSARQDRFVYLVHRDDPNYMQLENWTYFYAEQNDNNPYAGEVLGGRYTQGVDTLDWIPDSNDTAAPLPHNRTQKCHFAVRLTPPEPNLVSGAIARVKQVVAYGFQTDFTFRVMHVTNRCVVGGYDSPLCFRRMADGFAFVIKNDAAQRMSQGANDMGYALERTVEEKFHAEDFRK